MTVTYTAKVSTSSMGCFLRLLLRWRGSVYKLVWREFLIFFLLYYILAFIYRFALTEPGKRNFEMVARYCEANNNLIPLSFVLGFFVSVVLTRWWEQFNTIPWPDTMALLLTASIQGHDERGRLMRRTIMRYLCLAFVITLSSISPGVKKRFPTFQHMTDAGFMLEAEQKIIEGVATPHNKYFIPLVWSTSLVTRGRKEGRIKDDYAVKTLIDEINTYRGKLGTLFNYDWISLPLVYTQVVTLAVYTFFLSCLVGRQFMDPPQTQSLDMYVPVFTFLQFLFYMGWLKVAETLVNPFGEDDDDFDVNQIIDRNLQVSYLVVDEMHQEHPDLIKDAYWDDVDFELPYTKASANARTTSPFLGSAMDINLNQKQKGFVAGAGLSSIAENLDEEGGVPIEYGPQNIPRHFRTRTSPLISMRKPFYQIFKRSTSRQTSRDSNSAMGSSQRLRRHGSLTSKGSEDRGASPTVTTTQDDIFPMDDLSDLDCEEPELEDLGDSLNSQTSVFWDALRQRQFKALQKKERAGERGAGDQEISMLGDDMSASRSTVDITVIEKPPRPPQQESDTQLKRTGKLPLVKELPLKPVAVRPGTGKSSKSGAASLPATPMDPQDPKSAGPNPGLGSPMDNTISMMTVPTEGTVNTQQRDTRRSMSMQEPRLPDSVGDLVK